MYKIVIGALLGDEGKGAVVNHFVKEAIGHGHSTIVCRFSGGPQASHTVVEGSNRHAFSSFGSGVFQNVPTFWSKFCLTEPGAFMKERDQIVRLGFDPVVYVDPLSPVITPYDRYANSADVQNMNDGTCGHGIGKTMERNEKSPYKLYVRDLFAPKWVLEHKLKEIRNYYATKFNGKFKEANWEMDDIIELFFRYCEEYKRKVFLQEEYQIFNNHSAVIFEGSQGLLLDRNIGMFPHVTYADLRSQVAIDMVNRNTVGKIVPTPSVHYVSRSYLTRHGNGPMGTSIIPVELINNKHENNVSNQFQGEFRVSAFDWDLFNYAVSCDNKSQEVYKQYIFTCMDQHPDKIPVISQGKLLNFSQLGFTQLFPKGTLFSYGPELKLLG